MSVPSHVQSHKLVHESSVWKWQPSRGLMSPWTHYTNWTNVPMSTPQNCPSQCPCPHSESQPPSVSSGDPPILEGKPGLQCLMRSPFLTWARVFTRPCVCPPTEEFLFPPVLFNSWDQTLLIFKDRFSGGSSYCQTPRLGSLMWDSERSLLWENFCGLVIILQFVGYPPGVCGIRFYHYRTPPGESNGTSLHCSCLENPTDGGAWWAAVRGIAKSPTRLSDFTFTFHLHALEKEMVTHSSTLAWRIPGTGEPGGLLSMGSHRVRHDWSDLAAAAVPLLPSQCVSFFTFGCRVSSLVGSSGVFLLLLMVVQQLVLILLFL